jgi:hypothetical protein
MLVSYFFPEGIPFLNIEPKSLARNSIPRLLCFGKVQLQKKEKVGPVLKPNQKGDTHSDVIPFLGKIYKETHQLFVLVFLMRLFKIRWTL